MIICVCRRISDRSLRETIAAGARTPAAVFRAAGCTPQCGACLPFVKLMINQACRPPRADEPGWAAAE